MVSILTIVTENLRNLGESHIKFFLNQEHIIKTAVKKKLIKKIIIIFIEETFSLTCGFRKGPQRLIRKTKISTLNFKKKKKLLKIKRTKNMKFIKHLN